MGPTIVTYDAADTPTYDKVGSCALKLGQSAFELGMERALAGGKDLCCVKREPGARVIAFMADADPVRARQSHKQPFLILDVRLEEDFAESHISHGQCDNAGPLATEVQIFRAFDGESGIEGFNKWNTFSFI